MGDRSVAGRDRVTQSNDGLGRGSLIMDGSGGLIGETAARLYLRKSRMVP